MCKFRPGFDADRREFLQGVADEFSPNFIELGFTGWYIPFPCSGVRTFDNIGQSPFFSGKFLEKFFALRDINFDGNKAVKITFII